MAEIQLDHLKELVKRDPVLCIKNSDAEYLGAIESVITELERREANIVLLAGPSSSGKTTTACLMRDILRSRGHRAIIVSLDDFYRDKHDPDYPTDENGEQDYESVDALHVDKIRECIGTLLSGGDVYLPKYSFERGASFLLPEPIRLGRGDVVIMEGLHALNPIITGGLDSDRIIKMFISVSTNINDGEKRILSGRKIRFIRRMTRDSIYRGTGAASTLARWGSVLSGEDKYLYPYRGEAHFKINTFHNYELAIMKPFALRAIETSSGELNGDYMEVVISAIKRFEALDRVFMPETSLICEFVPGGKYENM